MPLLKPQSTIVRKNSTGSDFQRRRVNLIEGTNVTLTVADDSTNDEVDVTIAAAGGTGAVATDTIWDAKGDLAVGTGADTAAKLTVGGRSATLMANSAAATGLAWVGNEINVKAYGALGDDSTDDTTAVQAAITAMNAGGDILYFPRGIYRINSAALTGIPNASIVRGAGRDATKIKSTTGTHNIFQFTGNISGVTFEDFTITTHSTSGHLFAPQGGATLMVLQRLHLVQGNPAKSIWKQLDFGYYYNTMQDCYCYAGGVSTVSPFDFSSATDAVHNGNSWRRLTLEADASQANHWFYFSTSAAAEHLYTNYFSDLTFEVSPGGLFKLGACSSFIFRNIDIYDMGTSVNSLFYVGAGSGNFKSRNITFDGITRVGGTLGASKYDIELQTAKCDTATFIACNKSNLNGMVIELNSNANITALACGNVTFNNAPSTTYINASNGDITADEITTTDEVYGAGWNGNLEVPTKNAVYDKIETISAGTQSISRTLALMGS